MADIDAKMSSLNQMDKLAIDDPKAPQSSPSRKENGEYNNLL